MRSRGSSSGTHPSAFAFGEKRGTSRSPKYHSAPRFSKFQVALIVGCVLMLENTLIARRDSETTELPPGSVRWETGAEAVRRAENKRPPQAHETVSNRPQPFLKNGMTFKESRLFHEWLDGLRGLEIGSSAHNGFGLDTLNVDLTSDMNPSKIAEVNNTGVYRRVDIISPGEQLPFPASSFDFIVSSHIVDHLYDPIGWACESARVVRPGGYIASISSRHDDKLLQYRERTTLSDLVVRRYRHQHAIEPSEEDHRHWQVWSKDDMIEMFEYMNVTVVASLDRDDKVGNGFSVIAVVPENKVHIKC